MTVKGIRVAFLAYTELTNGIPSPYPWSVNRADAAQILSDAHRARTDGAQVVIVNIHWGDEDVARPSRFQLALASQLTRSPDITAVVGQHVHIVQPIRILNGKLVVFGEGNLISNQTSACCPAASQDGMIVLLTITVDSRGARVTFIRYVPIWVRHPDFVVLPAGTAWRTDPADAAALRASYERTVAAAGRGPRIQPIPAHLLSAAWPAPRITSQRTGRQRKRIAPGVGGRPRRGWGRRLVTDGDSTAVVRHARSADLYPGRAHPHAVRRRTRTGRSVPANGKQERVEDQTIGLASGRTVGFADYGIPDATAVLWCHGGPGSRLEPAYLRRQAGEAGLRIIGIDRPGYGLSTPQPGRTIAGWVPEALAVADHLGIGQFAAAGISTGGAYALALAALAPARILGVVACCSMTDMRWPEGRATMSWPHVQAVWEAPDRAAALAAAADAHGEDGSTMRGEIAGVLPPSDLALFGDPGWMKQAMAGFPAMFAHGLQGYTDDRLADGGGWVTFDVRSIQCPVTVLHGGSDRMVDVIHAHHTAEVVPGADLVIFDDDGHFSIVTKVVPAIRNLLQR